MEAKSLVIKNYLNFLTFSDIEKLLNSFLLVAKVDSYLIDEIMNKNCVVIEGEGVEIYFKVNNHCRIISLSNFFVTSSIFNAKTSALVNMKFRSFMLDKTKAVNERVGKKYRLSLLKVVSSEVDELMKKQEKQLLQELEILSEN